VPQNGKANERPAGKVPAKAADPNAPADQSEAAAMADWSGGGGNGQL
jgi:hypothetical protein